MVIIFKSFGQVLQIRIIPYKGRFV